MDFLRVMYGVIRNAVSEWERAPDSEYKQGGLDLADLIVGDLQERFGEEDE